MIRFLNKIVRFKKDEDGNVAVEFVIMAPIFLLFMAMGVEIGMMTIRYSMLERSLDETVRWVRLSTGANPTHDALKTRICEYGIVSDCENRLNLEMVTRDVRDWVALPETYACTDQSVEIQPMSEFSFGADNELVVLRACLTYEPIFPGTALVAGLQTDGANDARLTAMTALVQEPR